VTGARLGNLQYLLEAMFSLFLTSVFHQGQKDFGYQDLYTEEEFGITEALAHGE